MKTAKKAGLSFLLDKSTSEIQPSFKEIVKKIKGINIKKGAIVIIQFNPWEKSSEYQKIKNIKKTVATSGGKKAQDITSANICLVSLLFGSKLITPTLLSLIFFQLV